MDLNPPTSVDHAFDKAEEFAQFIKNAFHQVSKAIQLQQLVNAGKQFAADHPVLSLFSGVAVVMCSFPFLCFCAFAVGTTIVVLAGFMFIEGVLLACGLMVLSGVLFCTVCLSVGCSLFILLVYYLFIFAGRLSVCVKSKMVSQDVSNHTE